MEGYTYKKENQQLKKSTEEDGGLKVRRRAQRTAIEGDEVQNEGAEEQHSKAATDGASLSRAAPVDERPRAVAAPTSGSSSVRRAVTCGSHGSKAAHFITVRI